MIQEAKPHSVAGNWGSERKIALLVPKTSSSRDAFRVQTKEELDEIKNDPFARFKNVQDKNPMLLSYNKRLAHINDSSQEEGEDVDPRMTMTTTARSMNEWLDNSPNSNGGTWSSSMRAEDGTDEFNKSARLTTTSIGLIGERLSLVSEPSKNSLIQRSWLYTDDPSLMYRINGLQQPESGENGEIEEFGGLDTTGGRKETKTHWKHGRRAVLTGDVLTKAGSMRAGVFLDDNDYIRQDGQEEKQR